MNEQFYELPKEKQSRIINAGLEVFAANDYKRAVTDDIAAKAGISKGLLFYYFHNKKSFYMFLFDYATDYIVNHVINREFEEITDFFELIEYAARRKLEVLEQIPHLMDFVMRCYYAGEAPVAEELNAEIHQMLKALPEKYMQNIDYSKFNGDIEPEEIFHMLLWMMEGYLNSKNRIHASVEIPELMEQFYKWERYFKKIAYKPEFQEKSE